jgi:hypothetical protein
MKKLVVTLLVVAMLGMAVPVGATYFSYYQYWAVNDSNWFGMLTWNLNTGTYTFDWYYGNQSIRWGLPYGAWYVYAVYDWEPGFYDEMVYIEDTNL